MAPIRLWGKLMLSTPAHIDLAIAHLYFKDTVVRHEDSVLNRQVKHRHLVKVRQDQA